MKLWRIAAETRHYRADDLSGQGAAKFPGRWNDAGQAVVYTAPTIAAAVLETAAHIDDAGLPLNRFLVEVTVPADVWKVRIVLGVTQLPVAWSAIPSGQASVTVGAKWLREQRSAILVVPSVVVPEEQVTLINPLHPGMSKISARAIRPFEFNRLFRV
jgi:RES domain-containing protein